MLLVLKGKLSSNIHDNKEVNTERGSKKKNISVIQLYVISNKIAMSILFALWET